MLIGTVPFKASTLKDLNKLIKLGKIEYYHEISKEAKSLIESLLKVNPEERSSIPEILNHPWLKNGEPKREKMISKEDVGNMILKDGMNDIKLDNLFFKNTLNERLSLEDLNEIANDVYTHNLSKFYFR